MKISLTSAILFCVVGTSSHTFAEASAPQVVIKVFIEALQANSLEDLEKSEDVERLVDFDRIRKQPRHSYTVEQLKTLFDGVDIEKIEFGKPRIDKETKVVRVKMIMPISLDFELQHQNGVNAGRKGFGKGDFFRIIGLLP